MITDNASHNLPCHSQRYRCGFAESVDTITLWFCWPSEHLWAPKHPPMQVGGHCILRLLQDTRNLVTLKRTTITNSRKTTRGTDLRRGDGLRGRCDDIHQQDKYLISSSAAAKALRKPVTHWVAVAAAVAVTAAGAAPCFALPRPLLCCTVVLSHLATVCIHHT